MRKIVLQMMTTINGRVDDPDAWIGGFGDKQYREIDRLYAAYDTILVGRTTYLEMAAYWPGAETEEGGSETNKRMAHKMNKYKKYVFSANTEPKTSDWNNTEFVNATHDADIPEFVRSLQAQPGGDILVAGGAKLAQAFVRLGLVDEYRFYVYPVISKGETWFDGDAVKGEMELLSATPFEAGVVGLYYRPKPR